MAYADAVIASGGALFAIVLLWHVVLLIYALARRVDKPVSPQSFFNYTVLVFCVFRIAHIATANTGSYVPFYMNRIALLIFITALSITLYTWMAALGIVLAADAGLVSEVRGMLDKLQWIFLIGNAALYVIMIITIAMYVATDQSATDPSARNPWYEASIILLAFVIFVMGVLFMVQAFRLYSQAEKSSAHVHTVLLRAAICSMVVALFFLLRVAFLLIRPVSNKKIDDNAFFVCTYYLPELGPLFLSLVVHSVRVFMSGAGTDGDVQGHRKTGSTGGGGVGPRGSNADGREHGPSVGTGASSSVRGVAGSSASRAAAYSTDGETLPDYDMPDESDRRPLLDA